MPSTYTLISANTLTADTAFVTFSAIPATFTDLIIRVSARRDADSTDRLTLQFNSDTSSVYSTTVLYGDGATGQSLQTSNATTTAAFFGLVSSAATADTFSNVEIYIPSYQANANKPISSFSVAENNAASTRAFIAASAGLWRNTATITSIKISQTGTAIASGSSFYLYGISNS
jgi:hypothetical protein